MVRVAGTSASVGVAALIVRAWCEILISVSFEGWWSKSVEGWSRSGEVEGEAGEDGYAARSWIGWGLTPSGDRTVRSQPPARLDLGEEHDTCRRLGCGRHSQPVDSLGVAALREGAPERRAAERDADHAVTADLGSSMAISRIRYFCVLPVSVIGKDLTNFL